MDQILIRLEQIFKELISFEAITNNTKSSSEDLKGMLNEFGNLVYTKDSNLFILSQLSIAFFEENTDVIKYNILLKDTSKLAVEYGYFTKIENHINLLLEENKNEELEGFTFVNNYVIQNSSKHALNLFLDEVEDKKTLINKFDELNNLAFYYIDLMMFHNRFIKTNIDDVNLFYPSISESYIYDKWLKCNMNLSIWKNNPNTNFLKYLNYVGIDSKENDKILALQNVLFKEALDYELQSIISFFSPIDQKIKVTVLSRYLALVHKFISGEFDHYTYLRLAQIINFSRPELVLVEIDSLFCNKPINPYKLLPYDGLNERKSPVFSAKLILAFQDYLNKELGVVSESNLKPVKQKVYSFGLIEKGINSKQILKKILIDLQKEFNILENLNDLDYLVEVFASPNFSVFNKEIQIGCSTTVFCYSLKKFKYYLPTLSGGSIETFGLFITNKDKSQLKKSNFNKSSSDTLKEKAIIDSIFNRAQ